YAAYSDREGALWLALGSGITRVDINSPISIFSREGSADVTRHGGSLYVTSAYTGIGISLIKPDRTTGLPFLQPLPSSNNQASRLLSFQDPDGKAPPQLLAAASNGVMRIEGETVSPALQREEGLVEAARSLLQSQKFRSRVFVGGATR